MSSVPRRRTRGALLPLGYSFTAYLGNGGVAQVYSGMLNGANGVVEVMDDYVTKPFVPGSTIVNTKMSTFTESRVTSDCSGQQSLKPPTSTGVSHFIGTSSFGLFDAEMDDALSKCTVPEEALIIQACTQALARVVPPEVSGLVTIAEIRSTVNSLLNPVQGALNWLSRNAPTKRKKYVSKNPKARAKAKAWERKQTAKDIANQHLTVVFGLLPFISDIQGILKALCAIEPTPVRRTARGSASARNDYNVKQEKLKSSDSDTDTWLTTDCVVHRHVEVRAYQLYEASMSLQTALGLELSQVPVAAWQTASLSFVVDWFANVGDFIRALTPQAGVTYITSGYTVVRTESASVTARQTLSKCPINTTRPFWDGEWSGTQHRVRVAKVREPAGLIHHVGLTLKRHASKDTLDVFKITAGISLITQRLAAWK